MTPFIKSAMTAALLALAGTSAFSLSPARAEEPVTQAEASARLVQFSSREDLDKLAAEGRTVVFFYATWCPNCILTLSELSERWAEIDPAITLVIADYDRETDLKADYGVTYQDTFVLLDEKAEPVRLWNAGGVAGLNRNAGS